MTTQIYPTIEEENRIQLYKQRSDKIITEIKRLQEQSKHYAKVSKKWNKASRILEEICDVSIGLTFVSVAVISSILTSGIAIPLFILIPISSVPLVELGVLKTTKHTLMKKRKEKYQQKSKLIADYINRVWLYYEKARQDGIISVEELEGFIKIINELQAKLDNDFSGYDGSLDLMSLRKQAEVEVKKEMNKEYMEKLKQELRQKYNAAS